MNNESRWKGYEVHNHKKKKKKSSTQAERIIENHIIDETTYRCLSGWVLLYWYKLYEKSLLLDLIYGQNKFVTMSKAVGVKQSWLSNTTTLWCFQINQIHAN